MQQLPGEEAKPSQKTASATFHAGLLDSKVAGRWMIDFLHPDGKKCPACGAAIVDKTRVDRWYQVERIKCSNCDRFYTSRTGTVAEGSTLDFNELYLLKCLIEWQMPTATIVSIIPINKETVARWSQRFQELESVSA